MRAASNFFSRRHHPSTIKLNSSTASAKQYEAACFEAVDVSKIECRKEEAEARVQALYAFEHDREALAADG
ncbi:hypothetical protein [Bradyrhizobium sp. AZCC 2230]|uniref:hypothetical protein n=1 Tax=Bradyrhizobium sp. AZCC 2230 TaxID=3117021 RepID=UPI002FEE98FE